MSAVHATADPGRRSTSVCKWPQSAHRRRGPPLLETEGRSPTHSRHPSRNARWQQSGGKRTFATGACRISPRETQRVRPVPPETRAMPGCASESQFGSGSSGVSKAGGPRAGALRGSLAGSPRWVRMRWTRLVAVTKAIQAQRGAAPGGRPAGKQRLRGALVGRNEPGPAQAPERAGSPDRAAWSGTGHLVGQPSHGNCAAKTTGSCSCRRPGR